MIITRSTMPDGHQASRSIHKTTILDEGEIDRLLRPASAFETGRTQSKDISDCGPGLRYPFHGVIPTIPTDINASVEYDSQEPPYD